jgi:fructose-1,6-bisphosphatase/inositol monophosphatase family enzyme
LGFHRARRGADVAGMRGSREHDADSQKRIAGFHTRIRRFASTLFSSTGFAMHPMLGIAVRAARRAASIINRAARDVELLSVTRKRHNDFVTEVDHAAERAVIEVLHRAYPDHAILAEESGASGGSQESEYTWIIDPLDGTTNFIHGFPQYAVSIALKHKNLITQGVIYDPTKNELFTASRGRGAYLNERRLRVSKRPQLAEALIATGFPFRDLHSLDEYLAMFRELTVRTGTAPRRRCIARHRLRRGGPPRRLRGWVFCLGYGGRHPARWEPADSSAILAESRAISIRPHHLRNRNLRAAVASHRAAFGEVAVEGQRARLI